GLHADAQGLVVAVGGGPDLGFAAHAGAADPGKDRGDDVIAEGEQGADGAGGGWRDVVAAGPAGFVHELLAAELFQVVGGLPGGVAVVAGDLPDPGGVLGGGEPARCRGQGERGCEGGADPRFVQVDAGGPAWPGLGGQRQLIQHAVGQEADIGAVQGGGEPVRHRGQQGDDLGEVFQAAAAAQLFGVVHGGLKAQDVFAFGVGLQLE